MPNSSGKAKPRTRGGPARPPGARASARAAPAKPRVSPAKPRVSPAKPRSLVSIDIDEDVRAAPSSRRRSEKDEMVRRLAELEAKVAELKKRGWTKANKSQLIRMALSQIDLDKLTPPPR